MATTSHIFNSCPFVFQLFLGMFIAILALMLRNVSLPWVFLGRKFSTGVLKYWFKFVMDFVFLVVPVLLVMTIFSQSLLLLACVLTTCLVTLLLFIVCEYLISPDRPAMRVVMNKLIDESQQPTTFVTYFRWVEEFNSTMLLTVAAAILAVDFPVFPRRYAKTEKYGHSLMDVGVAGFIFALVDEMNKAQLYSRYWWLRSSYVVLPAIGLGRTFVLSVLNYPQHVTEYGIHWNFFYTLSPTCYRRGSLSCGKICDRVSLTWILNEENLRETLFTANAEGICSLMGYITIYYLANRAIRLALGGDDAKSIRVKSWIECCWKLYAFALIFYGLQLGAEWALGEPSRRVVNITYIFAQMSLLTFGLASFLCVQLFSLIAWAANVPHFSVGESDLFLSDIVVQPCLTTSVNRYGLACFLLSNVLTGVINFAIDTHNTDDVTAMCILFGYLLSICLAVHLPAFIKWNAQRR
ncbi:unnamed protein product [Heligmosomoides polygyrus]|uniref:Phosphatidylinositol-glycan biosynthesis class W protein n=1 Tax=Heligmosomoides polygyrus TaxID=6339 RepID=A0A3P7Y6S1_HELPZ|nr:unnamed protein product [Heligmosomoides polygyrus]